MQHFLGRWKATCSARTPVRVLRMTREGLDLFLQQHPLAQVRWLGRGRARACWLAGTTFSIGLRCAQVHMRASMARGRSEILRLEALEKIASATGQSRRDALGKGKRRTPTTRMRPVSRAAVAAADSVSTAAGTALDTVAGGVTTAVGTVADGVTTAVGTVADGVQLVAGGVSTATLELFALVSKLRDGLGEGAQPAARPSNIPKPPKRTASRQRHQAQRKARSPPPTRTADRHTDSTDP